MGWCSIVLWAVTFWYMLDWLCSACTVCDHLCSGYNHMPQTPTSVSCITLVLTSMRQPLYTIRFHPPSLGSGKTGNGTKYDQLHIYCSQNMLQQCVLWEVHFRGPFLWVSFNIHNQLLVSMVKWRNQHGNVDNCPTCNQCIYHFDGLHIYRCSGCNMK